MSIRYFDGSRLRRSLLAAADWVAAGRDELNRLNVFPVPDGDTGTNMCLTLRAVAQDLKPMMVVTREGAIEPAARVRGAAAAEALRAELITRHRPKQCLVAPITPVIAAHAGVGAWGVFYQIEDGTNG